MFLPNKNNDYLSLLMFYFVFELFTNFTISVFCGFKPRKTQLDNGYWFRGTTFCQIWKNKDYVWLSQKFFCVFFH